MAERDRKSGPGPQENAKRNRPAWKSFCLAKRAAASFTFFRYGPGPHPRPPECSARVAQA
jgi:hypothetical protein